MEAHEKEQYVFRVFQSIADGYDRANNRISMHLHMRWKEAAVRMSKEENPQMTSVLDLGCGTGDMLKLFSEEIKNAELTGLDFSPGMLREAEKKLAGLKNIRLIRGNALKLPFESGRFDCVSIAFALRNTADYGRVISEMKRVLRKGGVICCVDSFPPDCRIVVPAYRLYFRYIMPLLGGGIKRNKEYKWLSRSTEEYVSAGELEKMLRGYGLSDIKMKKFMFGACVCLTARKADDGYEDLRFTGGNDEKAAE